MNKQEVLNSLIELLEKVVIPALLTFGVGFRLGANNKAKVKSELEKTKLQLELAHNEIEIGKKFDQLSDYELVDYATSVGRKLSDKK